MNKRERLETFTADMHEANEAYGFENCHNSNLPTSAESSKCPWHNFVHKIGFSNLSRKERFKIFGAMTQKFSDFQARVTATLDTTPYQTMEISGVQPEVPHVIMKKELPLVHPLNLHFIAQARAHIDAGLMSKQINVETPHNIDIQGESDPELDPIISSMGGLNEGAAMVGSMAQGFVRTIAENENRMATPHELQKAMRNSVYLVLGLTDLHSLTIHPLDKAIEHNLEIFTQDPQNKEYIILKPEWIDFLKTFGALAQKAQGSPNLIHICEGIEIAVKTGVIQDNKHAIPMYMMIQQVFQATSAEDFQIQFTEFFKLIETLPHNIHPEVVEMTAVIASIFGTGEAYYANPDNHQTFGCPAKRTKVIAPWYRQQSKNIVAHYQELLKLHS